VLRAAELDAGLQVGSQRKAEGQNHLRRPAGHTYFDAAHDTVGLLSCECTLPGHAECLINQHPKPFSSGLPSIYSPPNLYLILGLPQHPANDFKLLSSHLALSPLTHLPVFSNLS